MLLLLTDWFNHDILNQTVKERTMNKKQAFIVYANEKENGRVFHAMTYARQAHERGDISELYFAAEATAWPSILANKEHPMYELFSTIKKTGVIQGACENCAIAFDNKKSAEKEVNLIKGPECSYGQIDILGLEDHGYRVWIF